MDRWKNRGVQSQRRERKKKEDQRRDAIIAKQFNQWCPSVPSGILNM
jgi:hypothetical protein